MQLSLCSHGTARDTQCREWGPWRYWQTETALFLLPEMTSPPGPALAMSCSSHTGFLTGPSPKALPTPPDSLCARLQLLLELTSTSRQRSPTPCLHPSPAQPPTSQGQHRGPHAAPTPLVCPAPGPPTQPHGLRGAQPWHHLIPTTPAAVQPQDPLHSSLGLPSSRAPDPIPSPWGLSSPGIPTLLV